MAMRIGELSAMSPTSERFPSLQRRPTDPEVNQGYINWQKTRKAPATPGMVDEAVESVLSAHAIPAEDAHLFRSLMSRDQTSEVFKSYHDRTVKEVEVRDASKVAKQDVVIKYQLDSDQVKTLIAYAPELNLNFRPIIAHDHPMAAACRVMDHKLIMSKLPNGIKTCDVGGDPIYHIYEKHVRTHCCNPDGDVKDAVRRVHRRLRIQAVANDGPDEETKELARRYQVKDPEVVCSKPAQECEHKAPVVTAVHVYDIPLQDWPAIMEAKGASVVEGAVLFSPKFFEQNEGELESADARYRIDTVKDEFSMGFIDSPSWWYKHKWSDFARYGVDQILWKDDKAYSYKIVERRQDTIFYRVLALSGRVKKSPAPVYNLPRVPMVEVRGFSFESEVDIERTRAVYHFPKPLWDSMLSYASVEYERGVLDYRKTVNYYRSVAPKQTINGSLVMGGYKVTEELLVPLIVHVIIAAAARVTMERKATRYATEAYVSARRGVSMLKIFSSSLTAMFKGSVGLLPIWLAGQLRDMAAGLLEDVDMVSWVPEVVDKEVSMNVMLGNTGGLSDHEVSADGVYFEHYRKTVVLETTKRIMGDPEMQAFVAAKLRGDYTECSDNVTSSQPPTYVSREPESVRDNGSESVVRRPISPVSSQVVDMRKRAIMEAIEESHLERKCAVEGCRRAFRDCDQSTVESTMKALHRYKDVHNNPDFWEVKNGVLMDTSMLGVATTDFDFAVAYSDVPLGGENMIRLEKREFVPGDGSPRRFYLHAPRGFTGRLLTTSELKIFNGPEVVAKLSEALQLDHNYKVVLVKGPPGCGKTSAIVGRYVHGMMAVMCPVKESITDTRDKISHKLSISQKELKINVRTVDSYLVNHKTDVTTAELVVGGLLADECYMTHAGKWYAAAALLGVDVVYAYGDPMQIPHISRVQAETVYSRIQFDSIEEVFYTYRCPPSAVASWGHVYDWKVRSKSKVETAMAFSTDVKNVVMTKEAVNLVMYQADKKIIREMYPNNKVMSVHESEGKTFKDVNLFRLDTRKRAPNDHTSLFDQQAHCLVAMSRHTNQFTYHCPLDLGDLPSRWIKQSKDPRRVAAAADKGTAGISMEIG